MARPSGVTASAVVAFLGSAFVLLMGGLLMASTFLSAPEQAQPGVRPITVAVGLVLVAMAGLGAWTGVALLRVRSWARVSTLVFGGFLSALSALLVVVMLVMPTPKLPDAQQGAAFELMRPILAGVYAVPLAIGVWWLIYFNLSGIKAVFAMPDQPGGAPQRPLMISVIGWFSVLGGVIVVPLALMRMPAFLAGFVITGWAASLVYAAFAAIGLSLGWAVLRLKEAGRRAMIVWYGLTIVQTLYVSLVPGVRARLLEVQKAMPLPVAAGATPAPDMSAVVIGSMLAGVLVGAGAIWFLVKERSRFT